MSAIEIIKRRLKEDRIPETPEDVGRKKKRPREVAFMDINLCFPCGKCPEFCPVQCIEYLRPGSVPGRGVQPARGCLQEARVCYIWLEFCGLRTASDGARMSNTKLAEAPLGLKMGHNPPAEGVPAEPYEELFSEGGRYRHLGKGSRIR